METTPTVDLVGLRALSRKNKVRLHRHLVRERRVAMWRRDPLAWMVDNLGVEEQTVRWSAIDGYAGHAWDSSHPDPLVRVLGNVSRFHHTAVMAASGVGKTWLEARIALWFLDVFENSLVVVAGPTYQGVKRTFWGEVGRAFGAFRRLRPEAQLLSANLRVGESREQESWEALTVSGLAESDSARARTSVKAQGFHREYMLAIVDEMPGVAHALFNALFQSMSGTNVMMGLGNPDSRFDTLHVLAGKSRVDTVRVSALDYPNVVLGRSVVPGAVDRMALRQKAEDSGLNPGHWFWLSRARGVTPEDDGTALLRPKDLDVAFHYKDIAPREDFRNAAGVDPAASESGDPCVVAYGVANFVVDLAEFNCPNAGAIIPNLRYSSAQLAQRGVRDYDIPRLSDHDIPEWAVAVDTIGVGTSCRDKAEEMEFPMWSLNVGLPPDPRFLPVDRQSGRVAYSFNSLRSQILYEMAEDCRLGRFGIICTDQAVRVRIAEQFLAHHVERRRAKIAVAAKDEVRARLGGESPNLVDALAYWWVAARYSREVGSAGLWYSHEDLPS